LARGAVDQGAAADTATVFKEAYGPAVATLIRVFGDIQLAEDAVQDAFAVATEKWPVQGVPANPAGWIVTTARRRAIDVIRRSARGEQLSTESDDTDVDELMMDDQLRLIFTCCHPALKLEHRVALTLRLLGGLTVEEVARSFLVSESAMAKRLVRAKYKIKAANIPYRVPTEGDLPARLDSVLSVLYLIYNAGLEDEARRPLRREGLRLARSLMALLPEEPEVAGLCALMLLSESRAKARRVDGQVVLLAEQNRSEWDPSLIAEGQEIVRACIRRGMPGPFQLQAAIQAVHSDATRFLDTDWDQIVDLYDHLVSMTPTPVVAMNRAIALSEVRGPRAGLSELDELAADLDSYHLFHAAKGSLLRKLGRTTAAAAEYDRAEQLASIESDRRFLRGMVDELQALDRVEAFDRNIFPE